MQVFRTAKGVMPWVLAVAASLVVTGAILVYWQPRVLVRWLAGRNPEVLFFAETEKPMVALTIDDAPHPIVTAEILDVLMAQNARATFFVIGEQAAGNEALLDRMRREGHEIGNHHLRDEPSIGLPPLQFERELRETDRLIRSQGPVKWFRPGSGWFNGRMLRQLQARGYRCALGSVYPFDLIVRHPGVIAYYIERHVFPGAIIILHDGSAERRGSVEVIRRIVPALRQRGYQLLTLSELAASDQRTAQVE